MYLLVHVKNRSNPDISNFPDVILLTFNPALNNVKQNYHLCVIAYKEHIIQSNGRRQIK